MDKHLHEHVYNFTLNNAKDFTLNNAKDFILCLKTNAHISKISLQMLMF